MRYLIIIVLLAILGKVHMDKNREVRLLKNELRALKEEKPDLWQQSCYRAVNQSCYYADCAVTPIEVMEQKICDRLPEDL